MDTRSLKHSIPRQGEYGHNAMQASIGGMQALLAQSRPLPKLSGQALFAHKGPQCIVGVAVAPSGGGNNTLEDHSPLRPMQLSHQWNAVPLYRRVEKVLAPFAAMPCLYQEKFLGG